MPGGDLCGVDETFFYYVVLVMMDLVSGYNEVMIENTYTHGRDISPDLPNIPIQIKF